MVDHSPKQSYFYLLFSLQFIIISITAWTSFGYLHEDEHFQIIEFMAYKLGLVPVENLAWEYNAHLRPFMQIGIYYWIYKLLTFIGIDDRFYLAFAFRIISGWIAFFALLNTTKAILTWYEKEHKKIIQITLITLTGYIPFIMVRTSGESLAISFFLLGFSLIISKLAPDTSSTDTKLSWIRLLLSGICLGLSFEFKYQSAVLTLALLLWMLLISKRNLKDFLYIIFGGISVLFLSLLVDKWGYEEWTFPPWEYFQFNLLSENKNKYGDPHPFYAYFYIVIANLALPMVIVYLFAMFLMWGRNTKHVLTWISVLYFAIHCFIENKQIRFMFPLAVLAPFFIIPAFYPINNGEVSLFTKFWNLRKSKLAKFIYIWNLVFLFAFTFFHLWSEAQISNQKYIYQNYPQGITYICYGERGKAWDPYYRDERSPGNFLLKYGFYKRKNVKSIRIYNEKQLSQYLKKNKGDIYLFYPLPKLDFQSSELQKSTKLIWSMIPFHENKALLDKLFPAYDFIYRKLPWIEFPGFYKIENIYH